MNIDIEQLVRIVTEEVIRHLSGTSVSPEGGTSSSCGCPIPAVATPQISVVNNAMAAASAIPPPPPAIPRKRVLCLFCGSNEGVDTFVKTLEAWIGQGVGVDAVYSGSAKTILPMQRLESMGVRTISDCATLGRSFEELKNYDLILLPTLSRNHVAKMALGITDTLLLNLSYTALSYGLKTMGGVDGLTTGSCPVCANNLPGIPELLDEYQARVRRLGLQLYPMGRLVTMASHQILGVGPVAAAADTEVITTLITQHEAAQLPGPVVRVIRGGLVTPSARDVLSQRGIEVEIVSKS